MLANAVPTSSAVTARRWWLGCIRRNTFAPTAQPTSVPASAATTCPALRCGLRTASSTARPTTLRARKVTVIVARKTAGGWARPRSHSTSGGPFRLVAVVSTPAAAPATAPLGTPVRPGRRRWTASVASTSTPTTSCMLCRPSSPSTTTPSGRPAAAAASRPPASRRCTRPCCPGSARISGPASRPHSSSNATTWTGSSTSSRIGLARSPAPNPIADCMAIPAPTATPTTTSVHTLIQGRPAGLGAASVRELGRALLQERADRLRQRSPMRRHDLLAVLVLDRRPFGGQLERGPHALLGQPHAPRRQGGDLLGGLKRPVEQRVVIDHGRDEPDALGLLDVHAAAREHERVRARRSDQPGQQPADRHVAVRHADVHERHPEDRAARRVADVAPQRECQAEPGGRAVDRRDDRLRRLAQAHDQAGHVLLVGEAIPRRVAAVVARRVAVAAQVEAGAEPPARTRQHHGAARAVGRNRGELLVQRPAQLRGHRVQPVRAVEGEEPDLVGRALAEYDVGGHRLSRAGPGGRARPRPPRECRRRRRRPAGGRRRRLRCRRRRRRSRAARRRLAPGPRASGPARTGRRPRRGSYYRGPVPATWMWSASAAPPNGRVSPNRVRVASGTPSTPGVSDASPRVCGSLGKPPTSTECEGVR